MGTRRRRSSRAASAQVYELALAVPQVVAHRIARMALAGTAPSARDRREMMRMSSEKMAAFHESWTAMFAEAIRAQQRFALAALRFWWFPWSRFPWSAIAPPYRASAARWQRATLAIAGKGIAPVRRRAVANAKRLNRTSA